MAPNRLEVFGLALVMLCGIAVAQSGCTAAIVSLSPCLNYVSGNSSTPSTTCCSQLANVVQSQPQCLCVFTGNGADSPQGLNINQTLALALPSACSIQTPPVSRCNDGGANGPTSSTPSDTPSGSGSKTVPGTSAGTSNEAIKNLQVYVTFVLFIMAAFSSYHVA